MSRSPHLTRLCLTMIALVFLVGAQPCPTWPEDAVPDATIVVDSGLWDPAGASFTISFSMRMKEDFEGNVIALRKGSNIQFSDNGAAGFSFHIVTTTLDVVYLAISDSALEDDVWYDIVGLVDSDIEEVKLYIDGDLQDTIPYNGNDVKSTANDDICFGCLSATDGDFIGQICRIGLYDTALTEEQIEDVSLSSTPPPSARADVLAYWPGAVDETLSPRSLIDIGPDSAMSYPSPWAGDLSSSIVVE